MKNKKYKKGLTTNNDNEILYFYLFIYLFIYFFQMYKKSFNLESKNAYVNEIFFVYLETGSTYSRIIFQDKYITRIYTNL